MSNVLLNTKLSNQCRAFFINFILEDIFTIPKIDAWVTGDGPKQFLHREEVTNCNLLINDESKWDKVIDVLESLGAKLADENVYLYKSITIYLIKNHGVESPRELNDIAVSYYNVYGPKNYFEREVLGEWVDLDENKEDLYVKVRKKLLKYLRPLIVENLVREGVYPMVSGSCIFNILKHGQAERVDIYFRNRDEFNKARKFLDDNSVLLSNGKAIVTYKHKGVDIVLKKIHYGSLVEVSEHETFNLGAMVIAYDAHFIPQEFFHDFIHKQITLRKPPDFERPGQGFHKLVLALHYYTSQGYRMSGEDIYDFKDRIRDHLDSSEKMKIFY